MFGQIHDARSVIHYFNLPFRQLIKTWAELPIPAFTHFELIAIKPRYLWEINN